MNIEERIKNLISEYSKLSCMNESNLKEAKKMGLTPRYIDKAEGKKQLYSKVLRDLNKLIK